MMIPIALGINWLTGNSPVKSVRMVSSMMILGLKLIPVMVSAILLVLVDKNLMLLTLIKPPRSTRKIYVLTIHMMHHRFQTVRFSFMLISTTILLYITGASNVIPEKYQYLL